jgi:hypothetical protein
MKFNLVAGTSLALVVLAAYIAIEAKDILLFTRGRKMELPEVHPAWTEARE